MEGTLLLTFCSMYTQYSGSFAWYF